MVKTRKSTADFCLRWIFSSYSIVCDFFVKDTTLYFPVFYKYIPVLAWLSKEEVGELICAIMINTGSLTPKEPLEGKIEMIYSLMTTDANILFEKNLPKREGRREEPQKRRYGNFDPMEVFEKALERSYGKKEL